MKLSVVILNYNVRYFLELCLQSAYKAIENLDAEIIVVDNNSTDDSCAMVKTNFPEVRLIENKSNLGFSAGNNVGVLEAKGEYICILNPDTVVAEDTFQKVLQFAENKQNLGIVGCRLVDGRGKFLPESKRNIPVAKIALQKMLGSNKYYYANQVEENESGEVDVFVGAFMLMKKVVYDQVKGFDEDYFMYGEDIDLSYRILKAGFKNHYFGKTTIIHFKGESTLKDKQYAERFFGAMTIFYKKHFKKNVLFDAMIRLGIKMAHLFRKEDKGNQIRPKRFVILSNNKNHPLLKTLNKPTEVKTELIGLETNTEVIFDAEFLSFSKIILLMLRPETHKNATFKIIPGNADFMLGSNNSKSRGEVIQFKV